MMSKGTGTLNDIGITERNFTNPTSVIWRTNSLQVVSLR